MKKFIALFLALIMVLSLLCVNPAVTFAMKNSLEGFMEVSSIDFENVTTDTTLGVLSGTADISGCKYTMLGTDGGSDTAVGKTEWVKYSDITGYDGLSNSKYGTYGIKLTRTGSASAMARMENIFDVSKANVGDIYRVSMDMYLSDVTGVTDSADKPIIRYFLSKKGSSASGNPLASDQVYGASPVGHSLSVNKWIPTGFTFKITQKIKDEGINGLRIDSYSTSPYAQTTFIDNVKVEKYSSSTITENELNYTDSFEMYNHSVTGSADNSACTYLSSKVVNFGGDSSTNKVYIYNSPLASSQGKVRTGEKSLVQKNRASAGTAVKFLDLFNAPLTEDNVGEKYDISLWVYADKNDGGYMRTATDSGDKLEELTTISSDGTYFRLSLTGPNGQNYKYRANGMSTLAVYAPWNTWTEIKTSIFITDNMVDNGSTDALSNPMINSIRIDQGVSLSTYGSDKTIVAKTVYFDDLSVVQQPTGYNEVYRRKVPTEFEKSSEFTDDNLLYFSMDMEPDEKFAALPEGTNYVSAEDLFTNTKANGKSSKSEVTVTGQPFTKALRVSTSATVLNAAGSINTNASSITFTNTLEGCSADDLMLVKFAMRTVSGGNSDGQGSVIVQIQGTVTTPTGGKQYPKSLFETVTANSDWEYHYLPFTHFEDRNSITIRTGTNVQVIEIADFEIINYEGIYKDDGEEVGPSDMPASTINYEELEQGAAWRQDAIERIKDVRMGDINITVTDKNGYPVNNAKIDVNMYEHEFQFGTCITTTMFANSTYQDKYSENFNAAVAEHHMKWAPLEEQNGYDISDRFIQYAKALGTKYFRGHALSWERQYGSNGTTNLTPDYMFTEEMLADEEASSARVIQHIKEAAGYFQGQLCDWDVVNEIVSNFKIRENYSDPNKAFVDWFKAAREADPYADLYYNETSPVWEDSFFEYLDMFEERGVDYDGIGIQSHYDSTIRNPSEVVALYERLRTDYNKRLKVTEYSCSKYDEILQANYTRDMLIAAFAEENMDGFLYWGFWDGALFADISPFYDKNWNLRGAGKVFQDLVYNKWWTRESGTTDASGKFDTRGYYGEYDITVTTEDGYSETVSAELFKNAEGLNDVIIELSDYGYERSENDIFSFVYSGKIQIKGKVLLPEANANPDYLANAASVVVVSDSETEGSPESIMYIGQTKIDSNNEYQIEFKVNDLDYGDLLVNGCHVRMNINGELVEDTITTIGFIPDCVAFDITPNISDGKLNVAVDFINKIKRSGIDMTIYTALYGEDDRLIAMSKVDKTSNGDATEEYSIKDIAVEDGVKSGKILIWLNNGKLIPLTQTKMFTVTQ